MAPHILHIFPSFGFGGTELRMARVINSLGDEFRHTVVALNGVFDAAQRIEPGIQIRCVPGPPKAGAIHDTLALYRIIRDAAPDLLNTYNWGSMGAGISVHLLPGIPWIHHECGLGPDETVQLKARRVWARRILLRRAKHTVPVSTSLARLAEQEYWVREGKLRPILNGVDTDRFAPGDQAAAREALGLPRHGLLAGYVGMLREEKRPDGLVRMFASEAFADATLVLAGQGPLENRIRQIAAEKGIAGRVILLGMVTDTPRLYQALDVFALNSAVEGAPNSLMEAMASGLPCVSTDVGSCGEILGASNPGLVPASEEAAYQKALRALLSDPALRAELGSANRARILDGYSHRKMCLEYRELYRNCSGRS